MKIIRKKMAEGGYDENIELDDLSRNRNDSVNDDDENTALLSDEIRSTSTHRGARPKTFTTSHSFENPSFEINDPPTVDKRPTTITEKEENQDNAWDRIKRKFPKFNSKKSKFTARVDEFNNVKVRLIRRGSTEHYFFNENDELNSNLPFTFKKDLGPSAEKVIEKNDKDNERWEDKNREDREEMARPDISEREAVIITDRVNMKE